MFSNIFIPYVEMNRSSEAYSVKASKIQYEGMKEDTKLAKSEFRPQFGLNTRYTIYDIDEKKMIQILGWYLFLYATFQFW